MQKDISLCMHLIIHQLLILTVLINGFNWSAAVNDYYYYLFIIYLLIRYYLFIYLMFIYYLL